MPDQDAKDDAEMLERMKSLARVHIEHNTTRWPCGVMVTATDLLRLVELARQGMEQEGVEHV